MNKLVAIVGMSGSGKSVVSDYLESLGFNKIYFGGVVLDEVAKRGLEVNPNNERMVREDLRCKYGMAAISVVLLPKIKESIRIQDTVLDGLYSWDELLVLREEFRDDLKLICVVSDRDIRYNRVSKRTIRPLNRLEIEKRDTTEIENLSKGGPIAIADYYILNNGSIDSVKSRIDEILKEIGDVYEKNDK